MSSIPHMFIIAITGGQLTSNTLSFQTQGECRISISGRRCDPFFFFFFAVFHPRNTITTQTVTYFLCTTC